MAKKAAEAVITPEETEVEDGTETEVVQEVVEDGPKPEGDEVSDDGGETGEIEEGANDLGEEAGEGIEEPAYVKTLLDRIESLEKGIKSPEREDPKWKEPSEDEKAAMQEKYGIPYNGIQFMNNQMATLGTQMKQYIDSIFGQLTVNETIQDFSSKKGFEDAGKYKGDIRSFLLAVDPSARSNHDILEKAYFYAKGKSTQKAVAKVGQNREQNRRLLGATKTPAQGDRTRRSVSTVKLDATQRSAAKMAGWSEDEYIKNMTKYNGVKK